LHSTGTWIPLPPTGVPGHEVRWISQQHPDQVPHSLTMQWAIRTVLRSGNPATRDQQN
jgi:hypothetical protein